MGRWIHRKKDDQQGYGGGSGGTGGGGSQAQLYDMDSTDVRANGSRRNVFISFHSEDEAQVNLLRSQARNANLDFRDYSVKEPFDERWKAQCRERIAQTSATIVMIGPDTASREAVNWEIDEAYRQGKKVIGVRIYRDNNDPVPRAMKEHNAPVTTWDTQDIQRHLNDP